MSGNKARIRAQTAVESDRKSVCDKTCHHLEQDETCSLHRLLIIAPFSDRGESETFCCRSSLCGGAAVYFRGTTDYRFSAQRSHARRTSGGPAAHESSVVGEGFTTARRLQRGGAVTKPCDMKRLLKFGVISEAKNWSQTRFHKIMMS